MEWRNFGEFISSIAEIGWVIVVAVLVYAIFPTLRERVSSIKSIKRDSTGATQIDFLVAREVAEQQLAAEEEAQDEASAIPVAEIRAGPKDIIIWATGGNHRPIGQISLLEDAGFKVEEEQPQKLVKSELLESGEIAAIVTNLKHGRNYNGGLDLVESVRQYKPDIPFILYTSEVARRRRKSHIEKIAAEEVATNTLKIMLSAQKLSRNSSR